MFIGHFGIGFAAKKVDPKPSLGTMFLAAQFLDLIWPAFILIGWETVKIVPGLTPANPLEFTYYPFSHSLLMVFGWGILFAFIYYLIRNDLRSSIILGILVLSHWMLDLIVHVPDLPLDPWSQTYFGFGLWNSVPISLLLEVIIFGGGIYLYISSTSPKNKKGTYALWGLIIFLFVIHIINLFSAPPPSVEAIGFAGLLQWFLIPWAYWIDRNRAASVKNVGNVKRQETAKSYANK